MEDVPVSHWQWFLRVNAAGKGYQTLINDALREYLTKDSGNLEETLRKVIREEMGRAA